MSHIDMKENVWSLRRLGQTRRRLVGVGRRYWDLISSHHQNSSCSCARQVPDARRQPQIMEARPRWENGHSVWHDHDNV